MSVRSSWRPVDQKENGESSSPLNVLLIVKSRLKESTTSQTRVRGIQCGFVRFHLDRCGLEPAMRVQVRDDQLRGLQQIERAARVQEERILPGAVHAAAR